MYVSTHLPYALGATSHALGIYFNIHFYHGSKDGDSDALGGPSITESNFLDMLGVLLVTGLIRVVHRTSGQIVSRTNARLECVYCDASKCLRRVSVS